jgi:hypothetical protein
MSLTLNDDQLERLADLIAARLASSPLGDAVFSKRLVDAETLGRMLGLSRSTVYEHAGELGGVRLGDGPRAPVRFDPDRAVSAWTARQGSEGSPVPDVPVDAGVRRRRRSVAAQSEGRLLPVRGDELTSRGPNGFSERKAA